MSIRRTSKHCEQRRAKRRLTLSKSETVSARDPTKWRAMDFRSVSLQSIVYATNKRPQASKCRFGGEKPSASQRRRSGKPLFDLLSERFEVRGVKLKASMELRQTKLASLFYHDPIHPVSGGLKGNSPFDNHQKPSK